MFQHYHLLTHLSSVKKSPEDGEKILMCAVNSIQR